MRSALLLGTTSVSSPAGQCWHVRRRWVARRRPRWRGVPAAKATANAFSLPEMGGPEDLVTTVAIVLGAVVVAVIVIPLLLFGIELVLLGFVIAGGIVGRGLFGRPWIVEARRLGESTPVHAWQVGGWRSSARLIDEVATALSAGLDPEPAEP